MIEAKRKLIHKIYLEILETYPFLTSKERQTFESEASEVLDKRDPDLLKKINKLLGLLHNPHADTWPLKEESEKDPPKKPFLQTDDEILYMRIPAWTKRLENLADNLISFCWKSREKYKAIIIDVRENTGGSSFIAHKFAGIFFKEDVHFGTFVKRIKGDGLQEKEAVMPPNGEIYIDKPLVILISKKCFSSNELFLAPFKVTGRATLIGEKTAGGSGNPVEIPLEITGKKYIARIPTWRFTLKGEMKPIEETSILPDIEYMKSDIIDYSRKYMKKSLQ